jgi:hypothetical protein
MMAFAIDIGYAVEVRSELVNATDAAALAGVQQLYGPYQQWLAATGAANSNVISNILSTVTSTLTSSSATPSSIVTNAITLAKATATAVANSNRAGGSSVQLVSADVDVGYTDATGKYYSGSQGTIPSTAFPNTVIVTARRDNTNLPSSNGEVKLFFGPILGKNSIALAASATAVAYQGMVTNFNRISGVNGTILPVAVDMTMWTDFYKNGATSQYADANAPSGTAWLQIYPGGTGSSMDGLLSLDGTKAPPDSDYAGAPPNGGWIQCGPTPANIAGLQSAGDLPLPTSGAGQTWDTGPGMKSQMITDFQALITTPPIPRLMALYDPSSSGTTGGGNGTYQICYFVPVYVIYAQNTGKSKMDIAVVPAPGDASFDPTVGYGNVTPMGSSTTIPSQYLVSVPAKLTK